jgi:hypothetical protein
VLVGESPGVEQREAREEALVARIVDVDPER